MNVDAPKDSCKALPPARSRAATGWPQDSDGARGWTVFAGSVSTAVLAITGLAF